MNPYQNEITKCKELLAAEGVLLSIIEESFLPDETETLEEVMGSVYMAIENAKLDLSIAEKIVGEIFKEYFAVTELPQTNEVSEFTQEIEPDTFAELAEQL